MNENEKKTETHVMVDLETWGTASFSPIISIGAVKFDPNNIDPEAPFIDQFHVAIDPASLAQYQLQGDTIMWWIDPDRDEARKRWLAMPKVDLINALEGFAAWFGDNPNTPIWGNGSDFDNVVLANAYRLTGIPQPWSFRSNRCYRTIKNIVPIPAQSGALLAHDALNDAVYQARHLQAILGYLRAGGTVA